MIIQELVKTKQMNQSEDLIQTMAWSRDKSIERGSYFNTHNYRPINLNTTNPETKVKKTSKSRLMTIDHITQNSSGLRKKAKRQHEDNKDVGIKKKKKAST